MKEGKPPCPKCWGYGEAADDIIYPPSSYTAIHKQLSADSSSRVLARALVFFYRLARDVEPAQLQEDTHSPRLWHPDLHLDNIYVDPESKQITSIIDWQGSTVMPPYRQCGIPIAFEHPGPGPLPWEILDLPEHYEDLSGEEKADVDATRWSKLSHIYYEMRTKMLNPTNWAAIRMDHLGLRVKPAYYAISLWEGQNVYFFRKALIDIAENWNDLCPSAGPCPFRFNEEELALQPFEDDNMDGRLGVMSDFLRDLALFTDSRFEVARFDQMVAVLNELREKFLDMAKDADERLLFERLWPYQDGDRHGPIVDEPKQG